MVLSDGERPMRVTPNDNGYMRLVREVEVVVVDVFSFVGDDFSGGKSLRQ